MKIENNNIKPLIPLNIRNIKKKNKMKFISWKKRKEIMFKNFLKKEMIIYKHRINIENAFGKIKHINRLNSRYDKKYKNYKRMDKVHPIALVEAFLCLFFCVQLCK